MKKLSSINYFIFVLVWMPAFLSGQSLSTHPDGPVCHRAESPGQLTSIRTFYNERAAFFCDNKWGFIDPRHEIVIPAQYDLVYEFKTTITGVCKNKQWFFIDRRGQPMGSETYAYIGPFIQGKALVVKNNRYTYLDSTGKILSDNWLPYVRPESQRHKTRYLNRNIDCPSNLDFDLGSFNLWTMDTGQVRGPTNSINGASPSGLNEIFNSAVVSSPLPDRHLMLSNNVSYPPDPYGGFPINSGDGSNGFIRLGSDQPGGLFFNGLPGPMGKSESVYYDINVPTNTINFSFSYNYAVVLNEPIPVLDPLTGQYAPPIHLFDDKPRFKVEIFDLTTNRLIPCGKVDFVADPSSAGTGGFLQSPVGNAQNTIWYKPWTKRFVNLAPYHGRSIRIKFSTTDCTLGGHWAYAYLDIEGCKNMASAIRSCNTPVRTSLSGPAGFQTYEWYTGNFSTRIGTGMNLVTTSTLIQAGDTLNLIVTPAPLPFITEVCPDTLKVIVQGPSLSYDAGPDKTFCNRTSEYIGGNPIPNATYSWTPQAGLNSTTSSLVLASPSRSTTYYLTVTDTVTACVARDTVSVVIKPSPNPTITSTAACYNQQSIITVTGGDNYVWTPDPTLTVSPVDPAVALVTPTTSGNRYAVRLSINASDCVVDTGIYLVANPVPIVDFAAPPAQCLIGNSFSLSSGSFINPGFIAQNKWIINNTTTLFGDGTLVSFPASGQYPIKLISTSDQGCKDSITRVVEVLPMPDANFTVPAQQCLSNNNFNMVSTSTVGAGSQLVSYLWDFGDNQYASDTPIVSHSYQVHGNYSIFLTITDNNGCQDTVRKTVQVFSMPIADFAQPDSQCLNGNRFRFTSLSSAIAPSTIASNLWYLGTSPTPVTGSVVNYSYPTPGTYRVKLVSTTNQGCKDSIDQVLMVFPEPTARFTLPSNLCFFGNNYLFTSSSSVANGIIDSCFWDFGDGTKDTGNSIRHSYVNPNISQYRVQLIAQTSFGCRDTTASSFSFLPSPQARLLTVPSLSTCSGDSIRLSATAQTPSGTITSYQWAVGGTDIPGATSTQLTVKTSGVYNIRVLNSFNCAAVSDSATVVVHPLPQGNVVLPNTDYLCEQEDKLLVSNSQAASFQWYLNGNVIPGATGPTFRANVPGIYSLKMFSALGCENFANGSISLTQRKKPRLAIDVPTYCQRMPVQFINRSDTSESGPLSWSWSFGDGNSSSLPAPVHTFADARPYNVLVSARLNECPAMVADSIMIIRIADTIPGIRYQPINAAKNSNVTLQSRNFGYEILWMPSSGLNRTNISGPIFNYDRQMEYLIRVRNPSGCPTFDTLLVRLFEQADFQVPTAFSPNGDGHNDYLDYFLVGIEKFKRFLVFNRWGQLLFQTTDPRQRWDGNFQGKPQPVETYVWLAEGEDYKGNNVFKRGQTILLR